LAMWPTAITLTSAFCLKLPIGNSESGISSRLMIVSEQLQYLDASDTGVAGSNTVSATDNPVFSYKAPSETLIC